MRKSTAVARDRPGKRYGLYGTVPISFLSDGYMSVSLRASCLSTELRMITNQIEWAHPIQEITYGDQMQFDTIDRYEKGIKMLVMSSHANPPKW